MLALIKSLTWYGWLTLTCIIPFSMSMFFVIQEWIRKRTRSLSPAVSMLPVSFAAPQRNVFVEPERSAAETFSETTQREAEHESAEQKQPSQLAA